MPTKVKYALLNNKRLNIAKKDRKKIIKAKFKQKQKICPIRTGVRIILKGRKSLCFDQFFRIK